MSDRVKAIEKRWAKVKGPWKARQERRGDSWELVTPDAFGDGAMIEGQLGEIYSKDEAKAVAAAPEDIAWLIGEVRRLRAGGGGTPNMRSNTDAR